MTAPEPPETSQPGAWAPPDTPAEPPPDAPAGTGPSLAEPSAAGPRRTNRFAVVALVAGLLGMVLFAVGFAVAAFVQTGRRGEKGTGLAVGGLAAALVWVAAIAVVVTVGPLSPDTSVPAARTDGKVAVTAMRPGDCFSEFEESPAGMFARPLPCTTPHQGEVSAEAELPAVPYPGTEELGNRAWTVCRERTEFLEKSRYGKDLRLHVAPPDEEAWKDGDHAATCVMRYTGSGLLPASLDQTIETKDQYTPQLQPGDCVKKWDDNGDQPLVPCTEEHEYEVLAVYTMPGRKYPGDAKMDRKALEGCAKRAVKVWRSKPPFDIADMGWAGPDKLGWEAGNRLIICLVTGRDGFLKHSVVPH
ncbi:septum formation family protein [Actinomadura sp. NAK00032]|uniref:DUF4190 domain-containing protein n=1 Tax=Actinomadura sp. NAK00032 TaxID=2742128 RepID=UPI001590EA47|nr:DUF4190 domain-containing protein [Actinomadura sp. NAK00032]QKW34967.1 septum formation family protein [Actinomadura sp. NAK00032]